MHRRATAALFFVLVLLLAGCGGGDEGAVEPTVSPTAPATEVTEEPAAEDVDPEPTNEPDDVAAEDDPTEAAADDGGEVLFADDLRGQVAGQETYASYRAVTDDNSVIRVEVPEEWGDIDGAPFDFEGQQVDDVIASTNVEQLNDEWTTPGVRFTVSKAPAAFESASALLDLYSGGLEESCDPQGRSAYSDGQLIGEYALFTDCNGEGVIYLIIGAEAADGTIVGVQAQIVEQRDLEALDRALATLTIS
jgi:hypothetical protein